ncbi:MAG: GNAT family N-acetyltransferase [Thermodesulfobacteriota bacterium]
MPVTADLEIRPIQADDLETVIRIQEAIIQRPVAENWLNLVKMQLAKPETVSLVAVRRGEVIGFFFGGVRHGDFGLEHSGWIEMFGVNPKAMGQGVGRALAEAAFKRFRELKVKDIYTAVRWDSGDLLAFFKNIGFSLSDFINLKTRLD